MIYRKSGLQYILAIMRKIYISAEKNSDFGIDSLYFQFSFNDICNHGLVI